MKAILQTRDLLKAEVNISDYPILPYIRRPIRPELSISMKMNGAEYTKIETPAYREYRYVRRLAEDTVLYEEV